MYLLKRRQWTSTQTISANIPPCLHVLNWYKSDFSARLKLRGVSFSRVFRFHVFAPWNFISLSPKNLWHSARLKLPFEAGRVFRMGIAKRSTGRGELLLFVLFLETSILLSRNIGTEKKKTRFGGKILPTGSPWLMIINSRSWSRSRDFVELLYVTPHDSIE